jgi:hypothetical protein
VVTGCIHRWLDRHHDGNYLSSRPCICTRAGAYCHCQTAYQAELGVRPGNTVIHLLNHEGHPDEESEGDFDHLQEHIRWNPRFASQVVRRAQQQNIISRHENQLNLIE